MNDRHAYMIICHNHFEQVMMLLQALDDERNDFYIHVDRKVKEYPREELQNAIKKGTCEFVEPVDVSWGAYSLVQTELVLLKAAIQKEHSYYHLISGADFPIKTQDEIHAFFKENSGKEYVEFCSEEQRKDFLYRVCWYHFFQEKIGNETGTDFKTRQYCKWEHRLLKLQRFLGVDRLRGKHDMFYKGAQWFSITHGLATFVVANEPTIQKMFRWSNCADESFLQVIVMQSPYKGNIVSDHMRMIDWNRGTPYVFRKEDYELLKKSSYLFARKFDEEIDKDILEMLYNDIGDRGK